MTIAEQVPENSYVGDGIEDTFAYTFRILENNDLIVNVDDVLQVESTDYTLQNQLENSGNVVFEAGSIPADTLVVDITRDTDQSQNTVYTPFDPFPADSHEDALDKLTMLVQELSLSSGGGGGPGDATHLRLDATNGPLTGELATQNVVPDAVGRTIGAIGNRYKDVFGNVGVFVNGDKTLDITFPTVTNPSALITGYQAGLGTSQFVFAGTRPGGMINGVTSAVTGSIAELISENGGTFAAGTAKASASGGDARIHSAAYGAFAFGYIFGAGTGLIKAATQGSVAMGRVSAGAGSTIELLAQGAGSFAKGFVNVPGVNSTGSIEANLTGSYAGGYVYSGTGSSAQSIKATSYASWAFGYASVNDTILASAANCGQFGVGTNGQADSFQVGGNIRIKGTDGPPASNLHNGDIWVNNNFTYIRSNGVSVQIT